MKISRNDLLNRLKRQISASERIELESHGSLVISGYNRAVMLRMLALKDAGGDSIDADRAEALRAALKVYLSRYMPDRPQGHKWIILSCIFQAIIVEEPMHPREIVQWERTGNGYACPAREADEDSICRWCVCRGAVSTRECSQEDPCR